MLLVAFTIEQWPQGPTWFKTQGEPGENELVNISL